MQREIKFRVWDHEEECFNEDSSFWIYQSGEVDHDYKDRDREITVQQYTGLKDKKKREIYEGDILKISNDGKFVPDLIDETWKEGEEFVVKIVRSKMGEYYGKNTKTSWYSLLDYENWEIIGNIFENPELLKN